MSLRFAALRALFPAIILVVFLALYLDIPPLFLVSIFIGVWLWVFYWYHPKIKTPKEWQ